MKSLFTLLVCFILWPPTQGVVNGNLRLIGGSTSNSGRLEIYYNGIWGTICDDSFDSLDALVACRQLGYSSYSTYGNVVSSGYAQGTSRILLDNLACTGSESSLLSCTHNGIGSHNCVHSEDVALTCSGSVSSQISSGSVRLVGRNGVTSSSLTAGRLEVYYNGQWGTVCDDSFAASEARTACMQLGFSGYLDYGTVDLAVSGYRFEAASSSTPTWLDNLFCSSSDTTLSQCTHNGIGVENCNQDHSEDVYVSCLGNGAIRLQSSISTSSSAGRLEIYYNGEWGTVCDDFFGQTEANVACSQLGYESASSYGQVGTLGYTQGSGTIWLDNLACTSSDSMLSSCTHPGFGVEDCNHSEDVAVSCSTTGSGSVRLVGINGVTSSNLTAGRLEVYYNGQWGTVCDNSFGINDARTACRQLGFSNYIEYQTVNSAFDYRFEAASSSTPTWLDNLFCSSSDTTLSQCTHNGIGVENCNQDHSEDVYVSCLGNGAVRLQGLSSSGRLEIYWNGVWGTICDDSFGQTDANVACRQLGYSSASSYGNVGELGYTSGSGTIWLDNLACTSSDFMLSSCTHPGFGVEDCNHSKDVAVSCSTTASISNTGTGSVRLVGVEERTAEGLTAGRLEVYYNGQWGTVCDDSFSSTEASLVCRQLGFSGYIRYGTVGDTNIGFDPASSSTPIIWLDTLSCSKSDSRLSDCLVSYRVGVQNCQHSDDVAVFCLGTGALRLNSFTNTLTSAGRLEVYYNGEWGTVCDYSFGQTDANVACRQLGYDSVSSYGNVGELGYSQGTGEVWLDNLQCTSSDVILAACTHRGFGVEYCSHSEDVALSCSTSTSTGGLSVGASVGIAVGVIFPCTCISVIVIAICITVCKGGLSSNHTRNNRNITTTTSTAPGTAPGPRPYPTTTATAVSATYQPGASAPVQFQSTLQQEPPPPYPGTANTYSVQPPPGVYASAAGYPQGSPYYPPAPYPTTAPPYSEAPPTAPPPEEPVSPSQIQQQAPPPAQDQQFAMQTQYAAPQPYPPTNIPGQAVYTSDTPYATPEATAPYPTGDPNQNYPPPTN